MADITYTIRAQNGSVVVSRRGKNPAVQGDKVTFEGKPPGIAIGILFAHGTPFDKSKTDNKTLPLPQDRLEVKELNPEDPEGNFYFTCGPLDATGAIQALAGAAGGGAPNDGP